MVFKPYEFLLVYVNIYAVYFNVILSCAARLVTTLYHCAGARTRHAVLFDR